MAKKSQKIIKLYGVAGMKRGVINVKPYVPHPRPTGPGSRGGTPYVAHPRAPGTLPSGSLGTKSKGESKSKNSSSQKTAKQQATATAKAQKADADLQLKNYKARTAAANKAEKAVEAAAKKAGNAKTAAAKKAATAQLKAAKQAQAAQVKQQKAAATAEKKQAVAQAKAAATAQKAQAKVAAAAVKQAAAVAKAQAKQAANNVKQAMSLDKKVTGLIAKSKDPIQRAALQQSLVRINAAIATNGNIITPPAVAPIATGSTTLFEKNDQIVELNELIQKDFKPYRTLTLQESRCDFELLNETFNKQQTTLKAKLSGIVKAGITAAVVSLKNMGNDVAGISSMAFVNKNNLRDAINTHIQNAFNFGKKLAAKELKTDIPQTTSKQSHLLDLRANSLSDDMANDIDTAGKQTIGSLLAKGVAISAVIAAVISATNDAGDENIQHIVGTVDGENMNQGRQAVFQDNAENIQGYERSEILDDRTCQICADLDGQTITADDPMGQLDQVHDFCRGIWVPIQTGDDFNSDDAGLPDKLQNQFDLVGGVPMVNRFTQSKTSIND